MIMTMRHNNDDAGYQYTRLVYTNSDVAFPEKYYSENFPKAEKYLKLIFLVM